MKGVRLVLGSRTSAADWPLGNTDTYQTLLWKAGGQGQGVTVGRPKGLLTSSRLAECSDTQSTAQDLAEVSDLSL